jgi:ABC-type multidrug transport system fused ATPase/permease subunit
MTQILVELVKLANTIVLMTKSIACANRIQSVLDTPVGMETIKTEDAEISEDAPAVEFKNVTLNYTDEGEPTLRDVDVRIEKGETVGVIGGTGSGKTSLVNLIPRFYDATAGEVRVFGRNVKEYELDDLRSKIAVVPQRAVLFKGTVRSNLLWGNENATEDELFKALEIAQAIDFVKDKEQGIDSTVEQLGKNLSGGQRQRLTIARALVKKSPILILDDSASALDFATESKLRAALKDLDDETTLFIISQRTSSISHADKIIVLEGGEVVGVGKHDDLLESCSVYREIYESQFKGGEQ